MGELFVIKNPRDNLEVIAFEYKNLERSIIELERKKNLFKEDPLFKRKLDNYLLLQKLAFSDENDFYFKDAKNNAFNYLNKAGNEDLKMYFRIAEHIVARRLDLATLLYKIDFLDNYFMIRGNNLYCVNHDSSTSGFDFTDNAREFLCKSARRQNRIVEYFDTPTIYSTINDVQYLVQDI